MIIVHELDQNEDQNEYDIAQCVHWAVFSPLDRAKSDISSYLKTVIAFNIYLIFYSPGALRGNASTHCALVFRTATTVGMFLALGSLTFLPLTASNPALDSVTNMIPIVAAFSGFCTKDAKSLGSANQAESTNQIQPTRSSA